MNLQEFKGNENNIVDPNVKRQMQSEEAVETETPKRDVIPNSGGKRIVTPQEMGFTHEEEEKIRPIDPILDSMDKAILRKQQEARIMGEAIEESDGEGLSKEEFEDVLEQNKSRITDEADGIPTDEELEKVEAAPSTSVFPEEKPSSDIFSELEKEEVDDEGEEVITPEEQIGMEEESETPVEEEDIKKVVPFENKKEESSVLNDDPFDHFESGNINFDEEIDDLDDNVDEVTAAQKEQKERMDKLRKLVKEKIRPVTSVFDISTFSISDKPAANVIATPRNMGRQIGDWVLMSSQKPIYMSAFSGTEIERLASGGKGRTRLNKALDTWQLIFDHIVDKHKPESLEQWAKVTSFLDIDHIYMAIYRANFEGANYMPYTCTNKDCKDQMFLSDDIDIMEMCKFKDKAAKDKFNNIIGTETDETQTLYSSEIVPVSDMYAIRFREPSIYNIIFESAVLDEDFVNKFGDLISICSYIDGIYMIDMENRMLRPVRTNIYPNNMKKTVKARIISFSKIISALTSDQYNTLIAYMQKINESGEELTYQLPAVTCPSCKTEIEATPSEAQELVFTRHQLGALATY